MIEDKGQPDVQGSFCEEDVYLTKNYHYDLLPSAIAQSPIEQRDESRLMVLHRENGTEHRMFRDMIEYLSPKDVLVVNESKVIPARLYGTKEGTGAKCETLLLRRLEERCWEALVRPGNKLKEGTRIRFSDDFSAKIIERTTGGGRILEMETEEDIYRVLERVGTVPLPPYIKKRDTDPLRYQTVYATEPGSAAAPTAGLHFTPQLLARIEEKGIALEKIVLHVGPGTFRPVGEQDIRNHFMHSEWFRIKEEVVKRINQKKAEGGRIIAVGTTSVRVLESVTEEDGTLHAKEGETDIFIYPGYRFRAIDGMVTNFHLPESTLLMLVSAFVGRTRILKEYENAIEKGYRFYSYGDAMLLL